MERRTVTAPTAEPIHITEAKAHLNIPAAFTDDDTLIGGHITVAREYVEKISGHYLVLQTHEVSLDDFPSEDEIKLGAPLLAIVSLKYTDYTSVETTWAASNYFADTFRQPGYLKLGYDIGWPSIEPYPKNAVRVQYKVGYAVPFTAATNDVLTATGHTLGDTDVTRVFNSGGALPTASGLAAATDLYARDVVVNTSLKLAATSGGAALDITATGSGNNYLALDSARQGFPASMIHAMKLVLSHLYENREATVEANLQTIPMGVDALIDLDRIGRF